MSKKDREANRSRRAAEIRAAQVRKERNVKIGAVAGVVVVISAIVAFAVIFGSGSDKTSGGGGSAVPPVQAKQNTLYAGNPAAKVKVDVYEDFQCPYCREFEESSRDFLRADAKEGKAYVAYHPFHLFTDPQRDSPAVIAYSKLSLEAYGSVLSHGTPEQALEYHDLLYDNQPYEEDNNKPDATKLTAWAKQVGAGSSAVAAGIENPNPAFFNAAQSAASRIKTTPTVLVNGKQLPGQNVPDIVKELENAIAQQ